ncbi:hypothetical protein N802_06980 [Knoellia sinensis KCTC 19936]|uniref:N-acetyltransferase domain-containing protein n=1 Tax=Knoellia sinensis KCTC 19936 TaxID=1385520 RepID=A0A0A0IZH7_9MICO|nr:hypothetical protein [Knoellia sinensis]KGN30555.1 hypothetical protein N802_06980 [Knoellia sinensis KCTC 19936]
MTERVSLAARNNALWCDTVCRTHEIVGVLDGAAWSSASRTPPLYPDAVTLAADVSEAEVLGLIDASAGASVKDSWAALDLTSAGFKPLITGQWVWRDPDDATVSGQADGRRWRSVQSAADMERWSHAWAESPAARSILGPALLDEPGVHVLAASDGEDDFVAGCLVNVTGEVAGLSNHFSLDGDAERTWHGAASAAAALVPERALVAWESGAGVAAARSAGFEAIGPLTVWIR